MSIIFFFNRLSFYVLAIFVLALVIQLCIHWIRFSRLAFYKRKPKPKPDEALEPVSVVVCARDAYEQLTELIPTLLNQDYPNFEVVVVNDCSDDETEEYLKDLHGMIFSELERGGKVSGYRRYLQTRFVTSALEVLGSGSKTSPGRALLLGELLSIQQKAARAKSPDAATQAHWQSIGQQIKKALE